MNKDREVLGTEVGIVDAMRFQGAALPSFAMSAQSLLSSVSRYLTPMSAQSLLSFISRSLTRFACRCSA